MFIPISGVDEKLEHPCLLYLIQIFDTNYKEKNGMKRKKYDQNYEILMYEITNCIRT